MTAVVALLIYVPYRVFGAWSVTLTSFESPDFEADACSGGPFTTAVFDGSTYCHTGIAAYFLEDEPPVRAYHSFLIDCATDTITLSTSPNCDISSPDFFTDSRPLSGTCVSESDFTAFGDFYCTFAK